ncbi:MAG: tRNA (adenosine(37)-N6)-dimethylallyltransferase MiaA [Chloroflexi bacterium]|nr:tRNA (adenosine(37)-N6)-dimethylallyltransferase MiaA [Chloroflexota bacterium]
MNLVVAVVGPTGIGKSRLGLHLAATVGGEIINADSRQVYRYMDIGTAKPAPGERAGVPHHLIDIVSPNESFSLALYQTLASRSIRAILQRGRLPVVVGGSGLYVWAVLEGWTVPEVPPDPELRRRLAEQAAAHGPEPLYQQLERLDPASARRINPRNVRRMVRAIEVYEATGRPASEVQGKSPPPFDVIIIGLTAERRRLYDLIDRRVDGMMQRGLVAEVKGLAERGYGFDLPSMSSVGYRQIGRFLRGELDLPGAVSQIKFETHRFARHQYAWFRLTDPRIRWFDIQDDFASEAVNLVREKMQGR